jgi:predicted PhzF superfamily epimerase YddE/YHI9
LQIFTPACELPFAGHPLVGAAWLVARETGGLPDVLRPARLPEPVPTFLADGAHWIRGRVADTPDWELVQLGSAAEVESALPPKRGDAWQRTQIWAWIDEPAGLVRARVFALHYDVIEDEACGSATLKLAAQLDRPIAVRHGRGSLIMARPAGHGSAEVGGRVVHDSRRRLALHSGSPADQSRACVELPAVS